MYKINDLEGLLLGILEYAVVLDFESDHLISLLYHFQCVS